MKIMKGLERTMINNIYRRCIILYSKPRSIKWKLSLAKVCLTYVKLIYVQYHKGNTKAIKDLNCIMDMFIKDINHIKYFKDK